MCAQVWCVWMGIHATVCVGGQKTTVWSLFSLSFIWDTPGDKICVARFLGKHLSKWVTLSSLNGSLKFSSDQIVSASMFLLPTLMRDSFSTIIRFSLSYRNYYINLIVAGIPRVRFLVHHGCFRLLLPSNLCLLSCWAAKTL